MKRFLLCTAIVGVALTSCVKEEATNPQDLVAQKITFDAPVMYSNQETRANVYGEISSETVNGAYSYPTDEDFVIYAIGHENNFSGWEDENNAEPAAFNGLSISYDINVDGWAPMTADGKYFYWNKDKMMSFAACSPADLEQAHWNDVEKRTYTADGLTIPDFEISADASKQYDLMFSTRAVNKTSADMNHLAGYYSGLPITFQHALSSIRFSIANSSSESVVLTGIEVDGVKYKGTFNENIVEGDTDKGAYVRNDGTNNGNVTPEWDTTDDIIANPYIAFSGSIPFYAEARYVSQLVENAKDENNICNQLLLMPQELPDDATVIVHYTVNGKANTKPVKIKGLHTSTIVDGTAIENEDEVITSWEIGKRYTYRLYYSSATADKDKIYFSPSTEDWEDVNVIVVPL